MRKPANRPPWPIAIVKLIHRKRGASLTELMKARKWQAKTVRAAISKLRKQAGLTIESTKEPRRGRVYRLLSKSRGAR